jgi:uncharacterized membrane protein
MKIEQKLSYILIIVIVIAFASVIYLVINPVPGEKFTEFYILGPDGKAGNYPTNLSQGETGNITIGIVNHEDITTSYQLVVKLNRTILKNETFNLTNNQKKEIPFSFQSNQSGNGQKIEFYLYKLPNNQQPYRYLDLLINVS